MTNIWGFFIQTIEVSMVAVLLLVLKKLLEDKLSPRWQYGIWAVLALKILVPAGALGAFLSFRGAVALQTVKATVERSLHSAFSDIYSPMTQPHTIPYLQAVPQSVTDWFFAVYAAGVVICVVRYGLQYGRIRTYLKRGDAAPETVKRKLRETAKEYGLAPCRAVKIRGISSPFVCGVIRPVMAVPEDIVSIDEKILLHELLHLKYKDNLQMLGWSLLRALHWCNPFLQYVFNRIGNDMESLCDQRVLERLDGEERREYGKALLAMTNAKFARAPGTTSISNGGRNIGRRIKAIARFKKYPKGMLIVSVCIGLILTAGILHGDRSWSYTGGAMPVPPDNWKFQQAMAEGRVKRCSTPAGAIDTWVKGAVFENDVYLAAATPISQQRTLEENIRKGEKAFIGVDYFQAHGFNTYTVYRLKQIADNRYEADLFLEAAPWVDESSGEERIIRKGILLPISVEKDKTGWAVCRTGAGRWLDMKEDYGSFSAPNLEMQETVTAESRIGTVKISMLSEHLVENMDGQDQQVYSVSAVTAQGASDVSWSSFNTQPKPDAEFAEHSGWYYRVEFEHNLSEKELGQLGTTGFVVVPMETEDQHFEEKIYGVDMDPDTAGGGTCGGIEQHGAFYYRMGIGADRENAVTHSMHWRYAVEPGHTEMMKDYWGWKVRFFEDGEKVDEIDVKRSEEL